MSSSIHSEANADAGANVTRIHSEIDAANTPSPTILEARRFLKDLRDKIRLHPAVNHIFLNRVATMPFTQEDFQVFGLQHYPLVCCFTHYMENLLIRAPNSDAKQWLAKVLVDEYGEGTDGHDHATLYAAYLRAAGADANDLRHTTLCKGTIDFIRTHIEMTTKEPFLVGLGAVGPGHEWSIPQMFDCLVPGLRRAGFHEDDISYFWVHQEQDQDHGAWLEEALVEFATTEQARNEIERGAMMSLDAREKFWTHVQHEVVRWRQPHSQSKLKRAARELGNQSLRRLGDLVGDGRRNRAVRAMRRKFVPLTLDDVLPMVMLEHHK